MTGPLFDRRSLLAAASLAALTRPARAIAVARPVELADLKERAFRFFWETTDARTGLAPDRWPSPSPSSIAAIGFALTAYGIGERNGWITRAQGRARTLATLAFLADLPQGPAASGVAGHKGLFYHFLDMKTGLRARGCELSTIDTALLMAGVLFAQSWFDRSHPDEAAIRRLADDLYARVDWTWIRPRRPFIAMGWHPESGFIPHDWDSFNEALLLYVLALASPTHPVEPEAWGAWTKGFDRSWNRHFFGQPHIGFAPLFGHQYSHIWLDFRGIRDAVGRKRRIDYWENSRRATYAQRNYAIVNDGGWTDYGDQVWGLTACDGPGDFVQDIAGRERQFFSYSARGPFERDDGTVAPTAAGGSVAFAPEIAIPALAHMRRRYGAHLYGEYGFLDAFNPTLTRAPHLRHGRIVAGLGWVADDYLGIDQGPILTMMENHDTGLVWNVIRRNKHIRRGLALADFTPTRRRT